VERFEDKDRSSERGYVLDCQDMGTSQSSLESAEADEKDDGIIEPSDTRDVLGLGLELAAEERASRDSVSGGRGGRGEIGADGDSGDWGVFRM
jgi:3-methylcrotonyl-CoA carboxylase beta subunit